MRLRLLLLLALTCLVSASAQAQKTDIDYAEKANFSSYKTYSWGKGTPAPNPLTEQRIIAGIDARLAAIGWQKVESDPDLVVISHVSVNPETTITTYSVGGPYDGYQWGWYTYGGGYAGGTIGAGMPTEKIQTIVMGELLVDITDVRRKSFIWRGSAKDTLKDSNPDKVKKKVEKAIAKLFKNFPPKTGKH
jgi:hypothetical protein